MRFTPTALPDVVVIDVDAVEDERGAFARTYSKAEFVANGLEPAIAECSLSYNARARTLRGIHYQTGASAEAKLVRCVRGRMFDVAVDVRPDSGTYLQWVATELSEANRRALYIPQGFAHGFLTLVDDTDVYYQISAGYEPGAARGLRWDDPAVGIDWPAVPTVMSDRDAGYPLVEG